jgi:DNA polymerase
MSAHKLFCDFETFSPVPLKDGTHRYAEQAEVMLFTYAFDDGPATCWDLTQQPKTPSDLADALHDPDVMTVWQNGGMFDRVVAKHALPWLYEAVPIERWYDTRVQALAHSLPGGLDALCQIFNVADEDKKLDGKALIQLFCKPPAKNLKRGRATRHTHPVEWEAFKRYATQDIPSMRAVHKKMPTWNYQGGEMLMWHLDQAINMRGVAMDLDLARAAIRAVDRAQKRLAARTVELTNGELQRATQRDKLLAHLLAEYGVDLPDLTKATLERRIDDTSLPWALRELLAIRLQASTTSASKYKTLVRAVSEDDRLRGTLQFCGASRTGRWAGRLFQPQNMMRPTLEGPAIDQGIEAMKTDCEDLITDNVMELANNAVRGCIVAPRGKKLCVADLSNIEGRKLAFLAGEKWKLKAFADFDTVLGKDGKWYTGPEFYAAALRHEYIPVEVDSKGEPVRKGADLYILAYARAFNMDPADIGKKDPRRQIGKVMELGLGYEGGVGAFLQFALVYGLDIEAMSDAAVSSIPEHIWEEARGMLEWTKKQRRSTFGLSDQAWMVCESFKRSWRYAHPAVSDLWTDVGYAVRCAIQSPGVTSNTADAGFQRDSQDVHHWKRSGGVHDRPRLLVRRDGAWLRIRLPSGRFLCYPSPQVGEDGTVSYMGVNQYSRKWSRIKTYGGKLVENITQAAARDVLTSNMPAIEAAGYEIVLSVHDELLTEAPDTADYSHEHLSALMATNPPWAAGLPLAAAGFEAYRYRKE